jgi:hypothetical protein
MTAGGSAVDCLRGVGVKRHCAYMDLTWGRGADAYEGNHVASAQTVVTYH